MIFQISAGARPVRAAALTLAFFVAACSEPTAPGTGADALGIASLSIIGLDSDPIPVDRHVEVCKVGPAGTYQFNIEQSVPAGGFAGTIQVSDPFDLDAGSCVDAFLSSDQLINGAQPQVAVTVTEINLSEDVVLDSVRIILEGQSPTTVSGPAATAPVNLFHGAVIIFYNSPVPPTPSDCVGLTPGYWKNWPNHYTADQFQELIDALPAPFNGYTAEQLVAILDYGGSDALAKLTKFYLANLLTVALTGTDLPNPSGGSLHPDCGHADSDTSLGDALEDAAAILADPGAYSKRQINALAEILDAFANAGSD